MSTPVLEKIRLLLYGSSWLNVQNSCFPAYCRSFYRTKIRWQATCQSLNFFNPWPWPRIPCIQQCNPRVSLFLQLKALAIYRLRPHHESMEVHTKWQRKGVEMTIWRYCTGYKADIAYSTFMVTQWLNNSRQMSKKLQYALKKCLKWCGRLVDLHIQYSRYNIQRYQTAVVVRHEWKGYKL